MALNSNYITALDLNPYFVDNATGEPLAAGIISFYEDSSRTTPKAVYQLTGSPPNYTYTALPNSLTLSSVGTIEDTLGNQVALYYYPYDEDGEIQLYYIVVTDADGNPQFTREAWPNITDADSPSQNQNNVIINQLSNPQFADVFFDPSSTWTITLTGSGSYAYHIGPGWDLSITATAATTVGVLRTAVAGISQYPTNPPYIITFTPGSNISSLKLVQRLPHNPNIWAPATGVDGGCVGFNVTLKNGSALSANYKPSNGTTTPIFSESNATGSYFEFSTVTQLPPANNLNTADAGYVDIELVLNESSPTTLTSVQVVGVDNAAVMGIMFNQAPVNRQIDQLFHYYKTPLEAKPINSYLVGWDFPLNPAQALGPTVAAFATGVNTSNYVWDQTICFQTANSGVSFSRDASNKGLKVTAAATGQFALIQYLDMPTAYQLLNGEASVNISAVTNVVAGIVGTVELYYCTDASLPDITTNNSIVATLNITGGIATKHGAWTAITRKLPTATFKVETSATTEFNDYAFNGWDMEGDAAVNTATFFAIVIGFAPLANTNTITFNSISVVPGSIPTKPAPQTAGEALFDCQRYYETSYLSGNVPGTAVSHAGALSMPQGSTVKDGGNNINGLSAAFYLPYKAQKRVAPTLTLYSDQSGDTGKVYGHLLFSNSIRAETDVVLATYWTDYYQGPKGMGFTPINSGDMGLVYGAGGGATALLGQTWISFQYVSDARLGVV